MRCWKASKGQNICVQTGSPPDFLRRGLLVISIPAFFLYRTYCSSVIADPCLTASRGPGKMASSRLPILLALAFSSLFFVLSHSNREMWFQDFFPPNVCPINAKANTFYGIMFDAGSTGTRIHIYTFVQKSPGETPCPSVHLECVGLGSNFPKEHFFSQHSIWEQLKISTVCPSNGPLADDYCPFVVVFCCENIFFVDLLKLRGLILGILESSELPEIFIYVAV